MEKAKLSSLENLIVDRDYALHVRVLDVCFTTAVVADESGSAIIKCTKPRDALKIGKCVVLMRAIFKRDYFLVTMITTIVPGPPLDIKSRVLRDSVKLPGNTDAAISTALGSPTKSMLAVSGRIVKVCIYVFMSSIVI